MARNCLPRCPGEHTGRARPFFTSPTSQSGYARFCAPYDPQLPSLRGKAPFKLREEDGQRGTTTTHDYEASPSASSSFIASRLIVLVYRKRPKGPSRLSKRYASRSTRLGSAQEPAFRHREAEDLQQHDHECQDRPLIDPMMPSTDGQRALESVS